MAYDRTRDRFDGIKASRCDNARKGVVITGSATDLTTYAGGLYLSVAGDVTGIPVGADADITITLAAHPVGYVQVQFRRVTACPVGTVALFQ